VNKSNQVRNRSVTDLRSSFQANALEVGFALAVRTQGCNGADQVDHSVLDKSDYWIHEVRKRTATGKDVKGAIGQLKNELAVAFTMPLTVAPLLRSIFKTISR
jgi:hypothetical protein